MKSMCRNGLLLIRANAKSGYAKCGPSPNFEMPLNRGTPLLSVVIGLDKNSFVDSVKRYDLERMERQ